MPGALPADAPFAPAHWLAPGFAPFRARVQALAPLGSVARLDALNAVACEAKLVSGSGKTLRFVGQSSVTGADAPEPATTPPVRSGSAPLPGYEARIFETGEVPTRIDGPGERHDLYNAIVWLTFPRTKARLNALQAVMQPSEPGLPASIAPHPGHTAPGPRSQRGPLRDAATLFDENAALWIGLDASFEAALRAFDWHELFVRRRAQLTEAVRLMVFGHALLEKLESPYKAITAHAWLLRLPTDASLPEIDQALSRTLEADRLSTRALCPLPVMGFPGWCAANADARYYDDPAVFRSGRRGGS